MVAAAGADAHQQPPASRDFHSSSMSPDWRRWWQRRQCRQRQCRLRIPKLCRQGVCGNASRWSVEIMGAACFQARLSDLLWCRQQSPRGKRWRHCCRHPRNGRARTTGCRVPSHSRHQTATRRRYIHTCSSTSMHVPWNPRVGVVLWRPRGTMAARPAQSRQFKQMTGTSRNWVPNGCVSSASNLNTKHANVAN